jgi:hypothetical protein
MSGIVSRISRSAGALGTQLASGTFGNSLIAITKTGRFEGATGSFGSPFDGTHRAMAPSFRSIRGAVKGTLVLP